MKVKQGLITTYLSEPVEKAGNPDLVDLINAGISPPRKLKEEDVYIRAMYIVSDQVNSFGGQFTHDEMKRVVDLLVDAPVMVGHRKDRLPIGRNFYALLVEKNGRPWIKSYFYWLKNSPDADRIRDNIDGGIYKECSLAFTFNRAECSICGDDIRQCRHRPFELYGGANAPDSTCCFRYRGIEKVLETSLVYRGAVANTSLTNKLHELHADSSNRILPEIESTAEALVVSNLTDIPEAARYLVTPSYPGLLAHLKIDSKQARLNFRDCSLVVPPQQLALSGNLDGLILPVLVVGYRGKQRCHLDQLTRYLSRKPSAVRRLEFKIWPTLTEENSGRDGNETTSNLTELPHIRCKRDQITRHGRSLATKDGLLIMPLSGTGAALYRYPHINPARRVGVIKVGHREGTTVLEIGIGQKSFCLSAPVDFIERLKSGNKILTAEINRATHPQKSISRTLIADIYSVSGEGRALKVFCGPAISGILCIRPIITDNRTRYLVYLDNSSLGGD